MHWSLFKIAQVPVQYVTGLEFHNLTYGIHSIMSTFILSIRNKYEIYILLRISTNSIYGWVHLWWNGMTTYETNTHTTVGPISQQCLTLMCGVKLVMNQWTVSLQEQFIGKFVPTLLESVTLASRHFDTPSRFSRCTYPYIKQPLPGRWMCQAVYKPC